MNRPDPNNWYVRSLFNIADNFGQARMSRSVSVKKAMADSFDIKISIGQAKEIITLMSHNLKGEDNISSMTSLLVKVTEKEETECNKIASFLSNFKR